MSLKTSNWDERIEYEINEIEKYKHILCGSKLRERGSQSFFLKLLRYLKNDYGSLNIIIFDYKKNSYECDDLNL